MNRLRILLLSVLILVTVAGALPITESLAKWSRRSAATQRKHHRRHSRAWWRRHHALLRARRERTEQRRQLAAANPTAASSDKSRAPAPGVKTSLLSFNGANAPAALVTQAASGTTAHASQLPFDFTPPHNWTPTRKARSSGAAVFNVTTPDGRSAGTAVLAPVALSDAELSSAPVTAKTKTVGGLSLTALRRKVIDRMVAEGGWVTNDFVQEIHGHRVFVVLAQTGAPGAPAQSWVFYFTEMDGRVYSLATTAPVEFAAPLALGSEQFVASLQSAGSKNMASRK
jgi:hypothetical protein